MNMSPETTVKTAICIGKLLSASSVIEKVSAKHSSHIMVTWSKLQKWVEPHRLPRLSNSFI